MIWTDFQECGFGAKVTDTDSVMCVWKHTFFRYVCSLKSTFLLPLNRTIY
jgi:hypothetical protein